MNVSVPTLHEIYQQKLQKEEDSLDPWKGSKNEFFRKLATPQCKGKLGVLAYVAFLSAYGYVVEEISDEGDVLYKRPNGPWQKDEVKTASGVFSWRKKEKKYSRKHWFNQIRPTQESWDNIVLVAVCPNKYEIYKMSRHDYFVNRKKGLAGIAPGHTGTSELDKVLLVDNSSQNCYNDWTLIHEGV